MRRNYLVSVAQTQDCLKAGLQTRNKRVRSPAFRQFFNVKLAALMARGSCRNRNCLVAMAIFSGLVAGAAAGAEAKRGAAQAVVVEKGPEIEGTLKSPLWQQCPPLELGECTAEKPGPFKTSARLLFDATHLYVAFDCAESDTAGIKQDCTVRDGAVWEDDCVELFVTGDIREGYFHFAVNPRGALMDARTAGGKRDDAAWNSSAVAKAAIAEGKGWSVTMSVPLKELGAFVGDNQTWVLNLNRTRPARGGQGIAEWSWAVMGSNDYHQVRDFGQVKGVKIVRRDDGVTREAAAPPPPPTYDRGEEAGGVTIYRKLDELTLRDTGEGTAHGMDLLIRNSDGLKVAFLARGTGGVTTAQFNMADERSNDNTTSDAYRLVGEAWRPVLYRVDRFFYNDGMSRMVARNTVFRNLRFHGNKTPDKKGVLELRNFVIYRGEDKDTPSAPSGLAVKLAKPHVAPSLRLSWRSATDNIGVALYVIARTDAQGKFIKVGESCTTEYDEIVPGPPKPRYRVLAVDFEGNVGPWSEVLPTEAPASPGVFVAEPPEEWELARYAGRVRAIHAAGKGKVVSGRVLCFGDSLTGATNYRRYVESALGVYDVWARGYPAMRTDFGRKRIEQELTEVNPEFCLVLYGTNNSKDAKALPPAMEDLLAIAASCEKRGTVPVIGTIPPRGFNDPKSEPEARYNEALIKACREAKLPIAYVFEEFLKFEAKGDRRTLLADDGVHYIGGGWEATARAWAAAMAQVRFALLDRE